MRGRHVKATRRITGCDIYHQDSGGANWIMSVAYGKILCMNDKTETWYKWDYVCPNCDSHIVMTIKSNGLPQSDMCPKCMTDTQMTLLSVVDATIEPSTTKKEETNMETTITIAETYNPNLLVTYKKIEDGEVSYPTDKVVDIEYALDQSRRNYKNLTDQQNAWYKKESQLRTLLNDVFHDSEDQETLEKVADIFDVPLTKEIEVTAWVNVNMTIEVDMREGEYDIEDMVRNNLTVDAYGGEITVNDYDVDRVEEQY
jgi:ssDNA-binding Zn-finger/Zn-ribbon topoisomerase 1